MGDMDLIRPLGIAGIRCVPVAERTSPSRYSRFVDGAVPCEEETGEAELLDALIRFASSCPVAPVLFYQQDADLLLVSRHRRRLASAFRFVIPDAELVEDLVDKARFQNLAERLRLPVPRAIRVPVGGGSGPETPGLGFPVIVKPLTRGAAWHEAFGSAKALDVASPEALRALWPRLAAAGLEFLIQEVVPGPETCIESYHVYVDGRGGVAAEFTGRKIRTWPVSFGHSTALTTTDAPDVRALGRSLVEKLGLRGVAKFDFKRGPDGRLHLLEVNPRFNLWHNLGAAAGVNIPAAVYADLVGAPLPAPARARAGARWCSAAKDYRAARAGGMSALIWAAWALRAEAKGVLAWDDPLPFISSKLPGLFGRAGGAAGLGYGKA